jgi:hypothetical protein
MFNGTTWISYDTADGLVDYMVDKIAIDSQDNVWITTGTGVSRLNQFTGIKEQQVNTRIKAYPNPATDYITVYFSSGTANTAEIYTAGMQKCGEYPLNANGSTIIPVSNLARGMYIVKAGTSYTKISIL